MCYNYYTDLAVARSIFKKQSNQSLNNSNEVNLRNNSNRLNQQNRLRTNDSTKSNSLTMKQILLDKEYSNLKNMLPSLNSRAKVSKVNLINEAVRYINELQEQVIKKLNIDPQTIQQKLLEEFKLEHEKEENNLTAHNLTQSSSNSNKFQKNSRSKSNKSLRRIPLEEINDAQKSAKRQRI